MSSIVINSKLRLKGGIHNDIVNLNDLAKADAQWDQVFVVGNIEAPHSAGPKVVPASDGQSGDRRGAKPLARTIRPRRAGGPGQRRRVDLLTPRRLTGGRW